MSARSKFLYLRSLKSRNDETMLSVEFHSGFVHCPAGMSTFKLPEIKLTQSLTSAEYDAVVVVAPSIGAIRQPAIKKALSVMADVDKSADTGCFLAPASDVSGKRVVYSSTGPLDQDIDDVRRFGEAMEKGVKRALQAGCKAPLLVSCRDSGTT